MSERHKCLCSGPGYCELFKRRQGQRHHEICSNTCPPERPSPGPVRRQLLIGRWYAEAGRPAPALEVTPQRPWKPKPAPKGPGTELRRILKKWDVKKVCPACDGMARQMDEWGVAGCLERRDEIIAWLTAKKSETTWSEYFSTLKGGLLSGIWSIGGLVDEAIRRARKGEEDAARDSGNDSGPVDAGDVGRVPG